MKSRAAQNEVKLVKSVSIPFFSVIITTYNRAYLIKRALESLISQTEKDWEAIIIDDESIDDTYSIIQIYLKSYPAFNYIRKPHGGEAHAKNTGIKAAKGRYVTFLDSDDEYEVTHLESRKVLLTENPSVKFLFGGVRIIGNQYVPDKFDNSRKINLKECVIGGTFFIERETLVSLKGLKDILIGPDSELFDRAKAADIQMLETNQATYIYHHENPDSITNRFLDGK